MFAMFTKEGWKYCVRAKQLQKGLPSDQKSKLKSMLTWQCSNAAVLRDWRTQIEEVDSRHELRSDLDVILTGVIPDNYTPNKGTLLLALNQPLCRELPHLERTARELIVRYPSPTPRQHERLLQIGIGLEDPETLRLLANMRKPSKLCARLLTFERYLPHVTDALRAKFSDRELIDYAFTSSYKHLEAAGVSFDQPDLLTAELERHSTDYTLLRLLWSCTAVTPEMAQLADEYVAGLVLIEARRAHLRPELQRALVEAETDDCWVSAVTADDIRQLDSCMLPAVVNNDMPEGRELSRLASAEMHRRKKRSTKPC